MSLLVATDVKLRKLRPPEVEGQYFESPEFGVFQVVSKANTASIIIKNVCNEKPFSVLVSDVFEAHLMEVI